ncbi:MAG: LytTR family DNA-binding domain-containing protein [Chitinophagaceae bacterium]
MIKAVIIDDEPINVTSLETLLKEYCPEVTVIGTASNSRVGATLIKESNPDLAFLDIEMPYGNAFDMLNELSPVNFEIIFVTAFNNYAINAIKYSALDYLLKPVNIEELQQAVEKAIHNLKSKNIDQKIDNFLSNLRTAQQVQHKMALPTLDGLIFLSVEDFVRLEANSNYTTIFLKDQKKAVIAKTLKEFENMLPTDNFSRIHNSHIVNHNYIKRYHRGRGGYLEMEDGTSIEVSVRKKDFFLSKFNK